MEDTLELKNMEAPPSKELDKKTDEVTDVNQVIPLNTAYERAGLIPPMPPDETKTAASSRKTPAEGEVDSLIGNRVAGYVVEETISAGGMGVVYRARQPDIGRCFAIKVLKPEIADSEEQSSRFFKEAQALSAIRHRGVTDIMQWGRLSDQRQYIVMEYLEGDNLEDVMGRDGAMPVYRVISIIGEVLDALSAAHKVGVVHRDLKPSNIFIAKQSDGTQCVKLLDFGLARQVPVNVLESEESKLSKEKASTVAGTPEYIAPEQARGLAATPRTDIYSLGVLAFEMLAGKLPFQTQSTVEMMKAHAYNEAPDIRDHAENIPNTLAELLIAMLKKLPEERPRNTDEVKQRLRRISQQLKDADTHVGLRLPPHMLELAEEQPKGKKFQKLLWPIAALPVVAGLGMYLGLVVGKPEEGSNVIAIAPIVQPIVQAPAIILPPTDEIPPASPSSSAELAAQTPTTVPKTTLTPPRKSPSAANTDASVAAASHVAPIPAQEVDCTVPANIWTGAMTTKLSSYTQRLTRRWRDEPEVRKKINDEFKAHQDSIRNSDGAAGTCEKISKDLDNWMKQYANKPPSRS
jgi:serine/threonine-protein kinase